MEQTKPSVLVVIIINVSSYGIDDDKYYSWYYSNNYNHSHNDERKCDGGVNDRHNYYGTRRPAIQWRMVAFGRIVGYGRSIGLLGYGWICQLRIFHFVVIHVVVIS